MTVSMQGELCTVWFYIVVNVRHDSIVVENEANQIPSDQVPSLSAITM